VIDILDLSQKTYYIIGRNKDLSGITLDHPSISKQHAVIIHGTPHGQQGCSIMDLGSSNKTFVGHTQNKLEPIQAHR
jgi:pSer/pThr/pTyr-binding forkhead associated (FHA) protein